jgi:hypothetical protein
VQLINFGKSSGRKESKVKIPLFKYGTFANIVHRAISKRSGLFVIFAKNLCDPCLLRLRVAASAEQGRQAGLWLMDFNFLGNFYYATILMSRLLDVLWDQKK